MVFPADASSRAGNPLLLPCSALASPGKDPSPSSKATPGLTGPLHAPAAVALLRLLLPDSCSAITGAPVAAATESWAQVLTEQDQTELWKRGSREEGDSVSQPHLVGHYSLAGGCPFSTLHFSESFLIKGKEESPLSLPATQGSHLSGCTGCSPAPDQLWSLASSRVSIQTSIDQHPSLGLGALCCKMCHLSEEHLYGQQPGRASAQQPPTVAPFALTRVLSRFQQAASLPPLCIPA